MTDPRNARVMQLGCSDCQARPAKVRGLCQTCYVRRRRNGTISDIPTTRRFPLTLPPMTKERIKELATYDPDTGVITRLSTGRPAGTPDTHGHLAAKFDRRTYSIHRLAWLYMYGTWPAGDLDHINQQRTDNRIANLRIATRAENMQNVSKAHTSNRSGLLGAAYHPKSGRWTAAIRTRGAVHYLGMFGSAEEAHAAYIAAKKELHPYWTEGAA